MYVRDVCFCFGGELVEGGQRLPGRGGWCFVVRTVFSAEILGSSLTVDGRHLPDEAQVLCRMEWVGEVRESTGESLPGLTVKLVPCLLSWVC